MEGTHDPLADIASCYSTPNFNDVHGCSKAVSSFLKTKKKVSGVEVGADQEQVDGFIVGEWDKHLQTRFSTRTFGS
jgi:hypothetical protein